MGEFSALYESLKAAGFEPGQSDTLLVAEQAPANERAAPKAASRLVAAVDRVLCRVINLLSKRTLQERHED